MNRRVVIILLSFTLLVVVLLWLMESPSEPQQNGKQKHISALWKPEYVINSADPRGLGFFNELLKTHVDDSIYVVTNWEDIDTIPGHDSATYLFVGEVLGIRDYAFDSINSWIDSGATMFLSYDHLTPNMYRRYYEPGAYWWDYSDKVYVAMGDTSLAYYSVFQNDTVQADWFMYEPDMIKDTMHRPFAWAMNYPIAYESDQSTGMVVMHSIPRLFCNYQVLTPNGFAHAEIMLRRIPKDRPVIWMEFGRRTLNENADQGNDPNSDENNGGNEKEDNSYLQFIMQTPALREAFLLAILVFLLYVFFRAKRRESILPGVSEKRNMSLAFVETLSSIYLSRDSPYSVLLVLRKNFYMAINRHFYIDLLNTKNREEDVKRLVEKASVDEEELRKMLDFIETNKPERVNHVTLSNLYRYIRKFYAETGIARPVKHFAEGKKEVVLERTLLHGGPGLLAAMFVLIRGLYMLSRGSGLGILIVVLALIVFYIAIRFLTTPVARITKETLTVYHPLFGKQTLDLTEDITYTNTPGATVFYSESGTSVTIQHIWLSRSAKHALSQFIEHIKYKSA